MEKVPYNLSEKALTIFWEGKPYTLRSDHPNFRLAREAIFEARYEDLGDLLDIAKSVENFIEGDIEVRDEVVFYKGHRLHGVVVDKLLEMLRAGMKDSAPLTNFISRLQANPSANSVNELYSFMSYKSLPNTPEGKVLGYKGVGDDFYSNTGNADTIVVQGKVNERHQIFNGVGETIEVARRCVDDNKDHHCSHGLHIGSYDYANSWAGEGGRLLVVEFDPEDAVSVPTDCDFQKLRVCKYKVVSDITDTRKEINRPVYEANKPIYGSDDDLDYDGWDYDEDYDDYEIDNEDEGRDYLYDDDGMDDDEELDHLNEDLGNDPLSFSLPAEDEADAEREDGEEPCVEEIRHFAKQHKLLVLEVRNYIDNKLDKGERVTINHVNSLKICRDNQMTCRKTFDLMNVLGYRMSSKEGQKGFSSLEIFGKEY